MLFPTFRNGGNSLDFGGTIGVSVHTEPTPVMAQGGVMSITLVLIVIGILVTGLW